jgi:isopenicillin-N epimerase
MAVVHLPASTDLPVLKRRLYDEYRIEIPLIEWNGNKLARISFQGYNTPEDLDALAQALEDLLPTASPMTRADSGF